MNVPKTFLGGVKGYLALGVLGTAVVATPFSCSTNKPGEISIKNNVIAGLGSQTYSSGAVFPVIPFIQQNIRYDGTRQLVKETVKAQSKDNIPTDADVIIEWQLNKDSLYKIHSEVVGSYRHIDRASNDKDAGKSSSSHEDDSHLENYIQNPLTLAFYTKEIRSRLRNLVGDSMKLYKAEEANDNRDNITNALRKGLKLPNGDYIQSLAEQVGSEYVTINDVFVRNIHLPPNLEEAMKKRAEALIQQQTAANLIAVEKNNALAEQQKGIAVSNKTREEADGKADAINKIGEAIRRNPEIIEYNRVEAQKLAGQNGGLIITNGQAPSILIQSPQKK